MVQQPLWLLYFILYHKFVDSCIAMKVICLELCVQVLYYVYGRFTKQDFIGMCNVASNPSIEFVICVATTVLMIWGWP